MCKRLLIPFLLLSAPAFAAYVPLGGWHYIYEGDKVIVGASNNNDSLDGSWDHNNSSDEWDGSGIGTIVNPGNAPGGISALLDGTTTYIRIQDTGDPGDYGFTSNPGRNQKIYLCHNTSVVADPTRILDSGKFIFGFRAVSQPQALGQLMTVIRMEAPG